MAVLRLIASALACVVLGLSSVPSSFVRGDYLAAVVQHAIPSGAAASPAETKMANLAVYAKDAAEARAAGAQIVVFPEFGLLGNEDIGKRATTLAYAEVVPDDIGFAPCDDPFTWLSSPAVYAGSCMARNSSIVVVINTFEVRACNGSLGSDRVESCPHDGQFVRNTDVAFDEKGTIIAVYRKTHPFYIFSVDPAPSGQPLVTFNTSFEVTFGLFICFDIAFPHPALDLVKAGVTNFAYAAAIGELGKSTIAKLWSWTNKANLLLSNHGGTSSDIVLEGMSAPSRSVAVPNTSDSILVATIPS